MKTIILKRERDRSVRLKHPWIFSGSISRVEGDPGMGETVDVLSSEGDFLGKAAFSPQSNIRARLWTSDNVEIGPHFFKTRIQKAVDARKHLFEKQDDTALRLVFAESDGLPGFIVDRYGEVLVLQCLTAGAEFWKEAFVDALLTETGCDQVYERSDLDVRTLEGLPLRSGMLHGSPVRNELEIVENGLKFLVNVKSGQKTGFYLDQRNNRQQVRQLVSGMSMLNCFCYTGGFTVYALAGGASQVLSVDSSAEALEMGPRNLSLNSLPADKAEWLEGDVFFVLRRLRDQDRHFDAVILDPPKFAPTAVQAEKAARGYKDINLLAFKLLNPGGLLFTFSCSGGISAEFFQKIIAGAAFDAKVDARILAHLTQGPDHPIAFNFPESSYLKGLVCQVI
jgi:23S rRNA (cytosine1962-C5)-methyltransferase